MKHKTLLIAALYIAVAAVVLAFRSTSSPLFPMNPWVDVNIYLTVAQWITEGRTLYIDMFDHKGPLLYIVYAVAYAVKAGNGYLGVYLLEFASMTASMLLVRSVSAELGAKPLAAAVAGLACPLVVMCGVGMMHGGSWEELLMPTFVFIGARIIIAGNRREPFGPGVSWSLGCLLGVYMWAKFSHCVIAFAILVFAVVHYLFVLRDSRSFVRDALLCVGGFLAITAAVVGWCVATGCLQGLWEVYLVGNLTSYGAFAVYDMVTWLPYLAMSLGFPAILCVLSSVVLPLCQNRKLVFPSLCIVVGVFVTVALPHLPFPYYTLPIMAVALLGISFVAAAASARHFLLPILVAASICMLYPASFYESADEMRKAENAAHIKEQILSFIDEGDTLVGMQLNGDGGTPDYGYFLDTGIEPPNRFFTAVACMKLEQFISDCSVVNNQEADFVLINTVEEGTDNLDYLLLDENYVEVFSGEDIVEGLYPHLFAKKQR